MNSGWGGEGWERAAGRERGGRQKEERHQSSAPAAGQGCCRPWIPAAAAVRSALVCSAGSDLRRGCTPARVCRCWRQSPRKGMRCCSTRSSPTASWSACPCTPPGKQQHVPVLFRSPVQFSWAPTRPGASGRCISVPASRAGHACIGAASTGKLLPAAIPRRMPWGPTHPKSAPPTSPPPPVPPAACSPVIKGVKWWVGSRLPAMGPAAPRSAPVSNLLPGWSKLIPLCTATYLWGASLAMRSLCAPRRHPLRPPRSTARPAAPAPPAPGQPRSGFTSLDLPWVASSPWPSSRSRRWAQQAATLGACRGGWTQGGWAGVLFRGATWPAQQAVPTAATDPT